MIRFAALLLFLLLGALPAQAAYYSGGVFCNVLVTSGGSISTGVTNTPSGGTLCVNSGSYSLAAGITLSNAITITGFPVQTLCAAASIGANCPGMAQGTAPAFMPTLTETSALTMFTVSASSSTIQGLNATGNTPSTNTSSCAAPQFASIGSGINSSAFNNNYLTNFTCAISAVSSGPVSASGNYLIQNTYTGINCSPCTGSAGTSLWQGNVAFKIGQNSSGTNQTGGNAYPFVGTYSGATQPSGITGQFNTSIDTTVWECFDNHDGTNIMWQNNLCVGAGTTTSASDNHNAVQNGMNTVAVKNSVIDTGSNSTLHDSIDMCALTTCTGSSGISGTMTISGNTILFGSGNGCVFTTTSSVSPSNNNGGTPCGSGINPNSVSSISLSNFVDGTTNQYTHGQPNHGIATISVNMVSASWGFLMPPGTLGFGGSDTCHSSNSLQIVGNQLVQAAGGSPTGACTLILTATLAGANMNGSNGNTFTAGSVTITGN